MKIHKQKETFSYTSDKNITVYVRIDYVLNKIDVVKYLGNGDFKKQELIFIGRGVEYMNGWKNILQAHIEAIDEAKKMYESNLALETKFKEDEFIRLNPKM